MRMTKNQLALARLMYNVGEEVCLAQERAKLSNATVAKRAGMNTVRYEFLKQGVAPAVEYRELAAVAKALGCRLHMFLADEATDKWATKHDIERMRAVPKGGKKPTKDWLMWQLEQASREVASWPTAKKAAIVKQRRPA